MTIDQLYDAACADAERRGLPDQKPVLEGLRQSTRQLRDAAWNDDARGTSAGKVSAARVEPNAPSPHRPSTPGSPRP
jgi:hypothetical protein